MASTIYLAGVVGPVRGDVQRAVGAEHGRAVHVQPRQVEGARAHASGARVADQHVRRRHLADQDTYKICKNIDAFSVHEMVLSVWGLLLL